MKKSIIIALSLFSTFAFAQKLDKFSADLGKKVVMNKEIRLPYTDVLSYYGFIDSSSKPDEERDGKKYYYLYVWIPAAAPELGVRMISPVPDKQTPEKQDVVSESYTNSTDKTSYFDTWITLERAGGITSKDQIKEKASTCTWKSYGQNDDSGELPAQPSGSKYNSLMRITSEVSNPEKALVTGLYRIGFTTYKKGEVQGSFLAQVGAPVKLPGVVIAKTLEELQAGLK